MPKRKRRESPSDVSRMRGRTWMRIADVETEYENAVERFKKCAAWDLRNRDDSFFDDVPDVRVYAEAFGVMLELVDDAIRTLKAEPNLRDANVAWVLAHCVSTIASASMDIRGQTV